MQAAHVGTPADELFDYLTVEMIKLERPDSDFEWLDRMRQAHARQQGNLSQKQFGIVARIAEGIVSIDNLEDALG